jgi:conjugal transfer/entry exclusion protein
MDSIELTMEQKFTLQSFKNTIAEMSHSQTQDFAIKILELMLARETVYKSLRHDDFTMASVVSLSKDYQ